MVCAPQVLVTGVCDTNAMGEGGAVMVKHPMVTKIV